MNNRYIAQLSNLYFKNLCPFITAQRGLKGTKLLFKKSMFKFRTNYAVSSKNNKPGVFA